VLPSFWPSGRRGMAVPKDRVDRIGVSGESSLSFRKAILLGPWRWRQHFPSKSGEIFFHAHNITLQNTSVFNNIAVTTSNVLNHFIVFRWPKVKEPSKEALLRNNLWLATLTYFSVTLRSLKWLGFVRSVLNKRNLITRSRPKPTVVDFIYFLHIDTNLMKKLDCVLHYWLCRK
jgi:hypothetical protein